MERHKIISFLIIAIFILSFIFIAASIDLEGTTKTTEPTEGEIVLEFFHSKGCTVCQAVEPVITDIKNEYGENITVNSYEISTGSDRTNFDKWLSYGFTSYPSVVLKNTSVNESSEFFNKSVTLLDTDEYDRPEDFQYRIVDLSYETLQNEIEYHLEGNYLNKSTTQSDTIIYTPFGEIDYSKFSLPIITMVLGAADSVNPCSFFVLLFLLSILLHTNSRKKMLLVGGIFIFFSGFVYFLLMVLLMNATGLIELPLVAIIAGIVAITFGLLNIKDFFFFKQGISASITEGQKSKLFAQMRRIVKISSIPSVIAATVILAISANTVELLCSLGLPLIYTGTILPLYALDGFQNYIYLLFYNVVYIIPLLIIVLVVVYTLGRWKLSEFQGQILKLFSGLMILALGITLILKIDLLQNIIYTLGILGVSLLVTLIISLIWKNAMNSLTDMQK